MFTWTLSNKNSLIHSLCGEEREENYPMSPLDSSRGVSMDLYIYIYVCVCVCVSILYPCVQARNASSLSRSVAPSDCFYFLGQRRRAAPCGHSGKRLRRPVSVLTRNTGADRGTLCQPFCPPSQVLEGFRHRHKLAPALFSRLAAQAVL